MIVRPGGCPSDYFRCDRRACVPSSEVCDLTDNCGDNSDEKSCNGYYLCDFESKNLCDWRIIQTDQKEIIQLG